MNYIIALFSLSALCVLWVILQRWLAKADKDYKGYTAGCGGCSRSCGESQAGHSDAACDSSESKADNAQFIDASSLLKDDQR